jgi:RNA ligase
MELMMNYEFPLIRNISDVLPAIAGRDEFVVAEKEGYTVINYNVMMADTFPDVPVDMKWQEPLNRIAFGTYDPTAAIRRECRGIIFDSKTGEILRRPFHKFFNVNEREETQDHVVDMSHPHAILEKLDGSMIAPFIVNDEMIWGTKMGATDVAKPVEEFVKNNPKYEAFALECIERGVTPIFEWCSRKQRIVLDYKEDQLILTAMRLMNEGGYFVRSAMETIAARHDIPVVRQFEPQSDMKAFLEYVRDLEELEGFVVRFDDGHMLKLKCHWYIQIHKAKEAILQDRNIVELILEEHLDDIKAHLPAEDRDRLTQFESDINKAIAISVSDIRIELDSLVRNKVDRKTFALGRAQEVNEFYRPIVFRLFGREDVSREEIAGLVRNTIRNNLGKTAKYEAIRDSWFPGVRFNDS